MEVLFFFYRCYCEMEPKERSGLSLDSNRLPKQRWRCLVSYLLKMESCDVLQLRCLSAWVKEVPAMKEIQNLKADEAATSFREVSLRRPTRR